MTFSKWFETFLSEKGTDLEQVLTVEGASGDNFIPVQCVVDAILTAPKTEQAGIKTMIVKIDFMNADVTDYFRHLAQAIAI